MLLKFEKKVNCKYILYFVYYSVFFYLGAVFTGAEAIKMGLADELYTVKEQSIREAIGVS